VPDVEALTRTVVGLAVTVSGSPRAQMAVAFREEGLVEVGQESR